MISHASVIEKLGGGTVVAADLSNDLRRPVDRESVYKWRKRNLIPARYWPAMERLAKLREISGITVGMLERAA